MSTPESVNRVMSGSFDVSTWKWISVRLVLPIVICGTITVGLQTTIAGGPKLAAADLPKLANLTPDMTAEPAPFAAPRQFAAPAGPGDARHQAAAAMLLLLVATAKSKRDDGVAQRRAAAADLPVSRQTADAGQVR